MVSVSDPPEISRGRRTSIIRKTHPATKQGSHGDPPSSTSSCPPSYGGECDGGGSGEDQAGHWALSHRQEKMADEYYQDDDFASMSTVPVENNGLSSRDIGAMDNNSSAPPSALRAGQYSSSGSVRSMSGMNHDDDRSYKSVSSSASSHSVSRSNIRQNHIELRQKRLASWMRINRVRDNDNFSVASCTSTMSDKAMQLGLRAMDLLFPPNKKRSRFTLKLSAILGLLGILAITTMHPSMRESVQPITEIARTGPQTRVLKDLAVANTAEEVTAAATSGSDFLDDFDQRRRRAVDLADNSVFSEPAHTRMCRAVVERLDAYDAGTRNFEKVIYTESEYVCRDPDGPYTAVLNMFAAQLLDSATGDLGLNMEYTHRCARFERLCTGNLTTIQFMLPDPLSVNAYAFQPNCLDSANLRTICSGCLASDDPTNPDCVLFPNGYLETETNTCKLGCHFRQVLPWLRNNLRTIATNWLNAVETRAITFWLRNAAEFSHREKDDMEVSVVALSCKNDDCDMSQNSCVCEFDPLPNWVYAMHIPRSSTNVAIVVSPTCARFGKGCTLHAQELYHFFGQLYPRADITYSVITSTSSWYMRMITADHLVCPPGVGCLLPAIARDAYTYVYETTAPTVSTWLTCTPEDYVNRLVLPSFPPAFAQGDCRHLRARVGSWEPDQALAPQLQYPKSVDGYLGCADTNFSPTAEEPYRAPTTHRWDESIWATCPVNVMNKEELCTQMDRLGLGRILFVGDHTTMSQAISLASILGQNDAISLDPNVVPNFTKTISCTGTTTITSFALSYVRNDRMEEPGTTPTPGSPNCGPTNEQYCYPWSNDFSSFSGKQLLIMNTGYHWGEDWEAYIANFQNFVGRIDEISVANSARANDVIIFRTSVPGHKECDLHDGVYAHYGEYCPRIVNGAFWHWWGELPPYNDYAIRIINEWNLLNTVKSGPNIELLDTWMMTILRPDGHLSGVDAGPNCSIDPQECMLYSLPGPVDWWNHLLVMQLKDIGTHLEISNPMHAWR